MALKFGKLKGIINAVAPTIGQALGGPLGGLASQAISNVLGVKNDSKSIENALAHATPEQLAEIKKAELEFEKQMKELDVDLIIESGMAYGMSTEIFARCLKNVPVISS